MSARERMRPAMLDLKRVIASAPRKRKPEEPKRLATPWGEALDARNVLQEHPRPQFARDNVQILNGHWDYAFVPAADAKEEWRDARPPQQYDGRILVPFSPEAPLSGVNRQLQPNELLWYRRHFTVSKKDGGATTGMASGESAGHRLFLHFDAVDYACSCYVNGTHVGNHAGAYEPFSFDITTTVHEGENEIALCVYDPSDTGTQLRGKQKLEAGGIWYTAQSGIWQTVWLETTPADHVASIKMHPCADQGLLRIEARLSTTGTPSESNVFHARIIDAEGNFLAEASTPFDVASDDEPRRDRASLSKNDLACATHVANTEPSADKTVSAHPENSLRTVSLIVNVPNPRLWSPEDPYLYQLEIRFGHDLVRSYCAFRTLTMQTDDSGHRRFCLNGKPLFLRGVLDQGYWPDGLLTAPSDEALVFDIQAMKEAGFNMLRKHIKMESARWYYHCDRMGMLVWQDMVTGGSAYSAWHTSYKPTLLRASWGRFDDSTPSHYTALSAGDADYRAEWERTCRAAIERLGNHPCIVTWVLFNEAWGQFEAKRMTKLVRELDPTRPIDAVSGWYDQNCGDYLSVHNYFRPLEVYPDAARKNRPVPQEDGAAGYAFCDDGEPRAFVISEFGGIVYHVDGHSMLGQSYGYEVFEDGEAWRDALVSSLATADALESEGLAGYVYTQLSDVEEETNGLLTYDRRVNKLHNPPA